MSVKRPLVNLCVAAFAGILFYDIYEYSFLCAVLFAALFFLLVFIISGKKMMFVCMIMMSVALADTYVYYNFYEEGRMLKVSVTDVSKDDIYGDLQGRRVQIIGEKHNLYKGDDYVVTGFYKNSNDIEKGICGIVNVEKVISRKQTLKGCMARFNDKIYERLKESIGERDTSIVMSAAFGNKDYISEDDKDTLNEFGVSHIISVSGFHISLIYMILLKISGFYVSTIATFLYVIFTGSPPSALRAFFMMSVLMLSKKAMKNYDAVSSLCLSALILVLYKPYNLFSIGFLLSYAAALGIILFHRKIRYAMYKLPERIGEAVSISLAAQVFAFPIIALCFKDVSLNFIWGNLFLVPFFSIMIILGDFSIAAYFIEPVFKILCIFIKVNITAIRGCIFLLDKISLPMLRVNVSIVCVYCILLICAYFYLNGFKKLKYAPIPLLFYMLFSMYNFNPKITFVRQKYDKGVYIESGFSKMIILKKSQYNNFNYLDYNEKIYLDNGGYIKIGNSVFCYDKTLSNMYIRNKSGKVNIKWLDKDKKRSSDYDIIDIDENGGTIYLNKIN